MFLHFNKCNISVDRWKTYIASQRSTYIHCCRHSMLLLWEIALLVFQVCGACPRAKTLPKLMLTGGRRFGCAPLLKPLVHPNRKLGILPLGPINRQIRHCSTRAYTTTTKTSLICLSQHPRQYGQPCHKQVRRCRQIATGECLSRLEP